MTCRSLILLPALAGLAACGTATAPAERPGPNGAEAWIDGTIERLSLQRKVGQMVVPWVGGEYLPAGSDAYDRLREWVVDHGIGGVVISIGPPLEVAAKLNMLQAVADVPLLVAADMEHGPGQRLYGGVVMPYGLDIGGGTQFPPLMAFGAAGDEQLAYELGRVTAREARATGIHMTYAPVVDVNNNPANPIINTRSFGEDPRLVARLAAAHIRGLQEHGLLATAKHFPGHGDTGTDSHIELPIITADRSHVDTVELPPYRVAIDAGVAGIMSAHIAFPALTGDTVPATLSERIISGLLQRELGFRGLVVTDALNMGGIVRRYGAAEAAVLAVRAGADVLLMPPDIPAAIDAVVAAVQRGEISAERIDRSVRKLLRAKASLGLHRNRAVPLDLIPARVGGREHEAVAMQVAERSITVARDRDRLLPIDPTRARRVLSIIYSDDVDPLAGRAFHQALARRLPGVRTAAVDARTRTDELAALLARADSADLVLFNPFVRVLAWKGDVAIAPDIAAFVDTLAARRPTIVTAFGNPYVLSQFPGVGTYLLAWGPQPVSQRAAARALTGLIPVTGVLPISIPPYHEAGTGIRIERAAVTMDPSPSAAAPQNPTRSRLLPLATPEDVGMDARALDLVDSIIRHAIEADAAPGAALAIGRHGRLVRLHGYGRLDWRPGYGFASDSSIYDLASMTKVVGTTTAAMILLEEGRLDLDAPVSRYLPEWHGGEDKARVTVRNLLLHNSGLPAYGPLWRELRGRDAYVRRIGAMGLDYEPGTRTVYSDFGIILLGIIVERQAGMTLDRFLDQRVFGPLGMRDTGFNPLASFARDAAAQGGDVDAETVPPEFLSRIAPTEVDTIFRNRHLHGEVHDENAYALGGVAGHAGLFSSARDLAVFAQMLLDGGRAAGLKLVDSATIAAFTRRHGSASTRALGWDTPGGHRSTAGAYSSARSFGHTGFTGTSIWVDPERDLFVILLTNRVNPTRANDRHVALRRAVLDAAQRAISDMPVAKRTPDEEP